MTVFFVCACVKEEAGRGSKDRENKFHLRGDKNLLIWLRRGSSRYINPHSFFPTPEELVQRGNTLSRRANQMFGQS